MENRKQWIVRAKRTRFGRMLCRLAGDNAGAVMMEYVVLALLICAAVVGVVMIFGDQIAGMFQTASKAAAGDTSGAADHRKEEKTRIHGDGKDAAGTMADKRAEGDRIRTGNEKE